MCCVLPHEGGHIVLARYERRPARRLHARPGAFTKRPVAGTPGPLTLVRDLDDTTAHGTALVGGPRPDMLPAPLPGPVPEPVPLPPTSADELTTPPPVVRRAPAWVRTTQALLVTADALVAPTVAALFAATRANLGKEPLGLLLPVTIGAGWLVALAIAGAYDARRATDFREESRSVAMAALGLTAMIAVVTYLLDVRLPRTVFVLAVLGLPVVSLIARRAAHAWVAAARRRGDLLERTLVVGRIDRAEALWTTIDAAPEAGYAPVGICAYPLPDTPLPDVSAHGVAVRSAATELLPTVDALDVDVVLLAAHSDLSGMPLRRLTWALEERGIDLVINPGLVDVIRPRLAVHPCHGLPLVSVRRPGPYHATQLAKTAYDRVLAALLLVLFAPVLAACALAVRVTSPGPVLYRQTRIGRRGRPFTILKFRTMSVDADARRAALEPSSEGNEVLFKLHRDPRLTRVGHPLRRFSLDELPQLVNVLRGDMSLVGPRPPLPSETARYSTDELRRLHARPGLTGLWQVSGRSDLGWEESVRLDLRYVDNWSPLMDLHILMRTASAVLTGRGAY